MSCKTNGESCGKEQQKQQQQTIQTNRDNAIDVKRIIALRHKKHVTVYHMAKAVNCDCAEYSAYEHERKPFPQELYKTCLDYLESI